MDANVTPAPGRMLDVTQACRAARMQQVPLCIWLTGLSGAGKSTIARVVERRLHDAGCHTYLLDGDDVRRGLNRDLGFTAESRTENIRRLGEVARLMVDAGLIVIVSAISPFRTDRAAARGLFAPGAFMEVLIDTPLHECEARDPKGLYAMARRGELVNFTGLDSPYEIPTAPELVLPTIGLTAAQSAEILLRACPGMDGKFSPAPSCDN